MTSPANPASPVLPGEEAQEHELKVWQQYADALDSGVKTFEFRKDDRTPRFEVGDTLRLRETRPMDLSEIPGWAMNDGCTQGVTYTGREWKRRVTYIARGGVIPHGYCVMSIVPLGNAPRTSTRDPLDALHRAL